MTNKLVKECSESLWSTNIEGHIFGQVLYHALYYVDFYSNDLDPNIKHPAEQFTRPPFIDTETDPGAALDISTDQVLSKDIILQYIGYIRRKIAKLLEAATEENLMKKSKFDWLPMTSMETVLYLSRHLMDHAGQTQAYLKTQEQKVVSWVGVAEL